MISRSAPCQCSGAHCRHGGALHRQRGSGAGRSDAVRVAQQVQCPLPGCLSPEGIHSHRNHPCPRGRAMVRRSRNPGWRRTPRLRRHCPDCCSFAPGSRCRPLRSRSTTSTASLSRSWTWAGRTSRLPPSTTAITTVRTAGSSTRTSGEQRPSTNWAGSASASPPTTPKARSCGAGYTSTGGVGVNNTGIFSRPLTKFAGRSGSAESSARRRSGIRVRILRSIVLSSSRAS